MHDQQLSLFGGPSGVRDYGLLESALARPKNVWAYAEDQPSLSRLAAAYVFGISSNRPFVDGNKRTAMVVSFAFLDVNGLEVIAIQEDAVLATMALAAGEMTEDQLTEWFQHNTKKR